MTFLPSQWLGLAGALCLGGGCATMVAGTTQGSEAMIDRVILSAEFHLTGKRLEVSYAVTNGGEHDVYLIDVAFRVTAQGVEVRDDALMVSYEAPATAVLSTRLLALDPSMLWATPPSAYGTRVAAGETYHNALGAALPLRTAGLRPKQLGPEGAVVGDEAREVTCDTLRFELGVIPGSPDLAAQRQVLAGKTVYQLSMAAWKHQQVLAVSKTGLALPLLTAP